VKARLLLSMSVLTALLGRTAGAGPWNIEPILGISADFDTNPLLHQTDAESEEHIAALLDFPLRYDGDAVEFSVRPYGRLSNSQGYSSLASNYAHLDSAAQFVNELGSTTLQAGLARDSSLYYVGALINGVGVPRDTESAAGDWNRHLTERSQLEFDVSWVKVRYDQPSSGLNASSYNLVDYRYLSGGPTFAYSVDELNTIKLLANVGEYQSLDGVTQSRSESLQLGFVHPLSEIWTLSVNAGYSQSKNTEKVLNGLLYYFYGVIEYDTESAKQNGTVYTATVSRQGERVNLTGGISRALQPTGFAFLSRQDSINFTGTFTQSERWDFALAASWQRALSPQESAGVAQLNGSEFTVRYLNASVSANWHWTPEWVFTMRATRITQEYGPPTVSGASTGLNLDIGRHFLRTEL
jgi:hypothetical protein